jgi:CDP-diacylglycerol--glycerol-3-phosphate 3-phosphatidyltransferase
MEAGFRQRIPNAITIARLALSVLLFVMLARYAPGEFSRAYLDLCLGVFLVASLTDWLDGFLARRWNATSRFGRIVDPFVDKILVLGTFIYLAGPALSIPSGITPTVVVIVLAREFLVTAIRSSLESGGTNFAAAMSGKLKMVLQCVTIVVCFLYANHRQSLTNEGDEIARLVRDGLIWAMVVVTILSGLLYVRRASSGPNA